MIHALWIEWRGQSTQTRALLALAGLIDKVEADPHAAFDDLFSPPPAPPPTRPRTPQELEERQRQVAQLAAQA